MTPKERISTLAYAYLLSSAIHAAAELGIADILSEKSEQSIAELAEELQVDARSLFRLLRFLVSHQIFTQNQNQTFSLNPESAYLADKHPNSIRHALLVNQGPRWNAFGAIQKAIITGKSAFQALYGKSYYEYLAGDREASQSFNAHMTSYTREEDNLIAPLLPIKKTKTLVDIGGGEGQFLNEILKNFQEIHGILFDLENTISNKENLKISCEASRWEAKPGDFFESVPANIETYLLKRVLHNWDDTDCVKILKTIRKAMGRESKLLIIEGVVPEDTSRHLSKDADFFLMALFPGCERTESEFRNLSELANLHLTRLLPTPTPLSVIELEPC